MRIWLIRLLQRWALWLGDIRPLIKSEGPPANDKKALIARLSSIGNGRRF